MIANSLATVVRAALAALAIVAVAAPAQAQQPPSANAIALAKEIITAKGAANLYDPMVPGVIERAKQTFIQINPMLTRDLNEIAVRLRAEMSGRAAELFTESARLYAARFTEQELKDALAFYKSAVGKKVIALEPEILDASVDMMQAWQNKFAEELMIRYRAEMKKKGHDL
jgi:hypothetical protein